MGIEKVVLENEVETIKVYRLDRLPDVVEKLIIPEGVNEIRTDQEIDERGFDYLNTTLKEVVLPESLTVICDRVFSYFRGLEVVDGLENVKHIGDEAFMQSGLSGDIKLSDKLKYIGQDSFYDTKIKSCDFSNSEITISKGAFGCCSELREIKGTENLISIQAFAFEYCRVLSKLGGLDKDSDIVDCSAFESCDGLE